MQIRVVRVAMYQARMPVAVRVRLSGRISGSVGVLVMFIVHMRVLVLHRFVHVRVLMPLADMQP